MFNNFEFFVLLMGHSGTAAPDFRVKNPIKIKSHDKMGGNTVGLTGATQW
jgi:hypothetical protein